VEGCLSVDIDEGVKLGKDTHMLEIVV